MRQLVIVLAMVACGKDGSPVQGNTEATPSPSAPSDWTDKALVAAEGEIDGIAFSLKIPEGLPRDKRNQSDWEDNNPKYDTAPKVFTSTIEIDRITSLDKAKYNGTLDARRKNWVRGEQRTDGWALTMAEPDKSRIEAITYKQASDTHYIKCKAVQSTEEGTLPSYDKARKQLETICDSLQPTGKQPAKAAD